MTKSSPLSPSIYHLLLLLTPLLLLACANPAGGNGTGDEAGGGDSSPSSDVTIAFDDPDNPVVSFTGDTTVTQGESLSVTAPAGYTSYSWYLDGDPLAVTNNGVSLDTSTLYIGAHSVVVVVFDGSNSYSAQFAFTVES